MDCAAGLYLSHLRNGYIFLLNVVFAEAMCLTELTNSDAFWKFCDLQIMLQCGGSSHYFSCIALLANIYCEIC